MGHDVGPISCIFTYVYVLFALIAWLFRPTDSLPIIANETVPRLTQYDISRYSRRTLKAIDWEACEFGDTLQPYDEDCPNGAIQILPCNPGQLKVSECIGQDGDTSRMCEPCPQKYFQSSYNKCTACHPCSECGPNEQIKDLCTDETDTVCESIIPPQPPEPTDPPTDVSDAPGQNPSTQPVIESTEGPTTAVSTAKETTKKAPITDGPVTVPTTQHISAPPPGPSRNQGPSGVTIGIWVMTAFAWIFIVVLMGVVLKLKWELKEEKMKNKDLTRRLAVPSSTVPSSNAEIQSEHGASVQFSNRPNGSLRSERRVDNHEGSPETERRDPFVDNPDDEKPSLFIRMLNSLSPLLPSRVVQDSEGKKGGKKASAKVTYHAKASCDSHNGRSARDPSLTVTSRPLPTGDRKNLKKSAGITNAESMKGEGALCAPEVTPPVNRRDSDASHHCNGNPTSSTITVDVHIPGDQPGERERGDGDSLDVSSVVRDGHPSQGRDSRDPSLRDRDNLELHPGNDTDNSNHDLPWPAEKVPASSPFPPPPPLDSNERWHAEKVPGSSALPPTCANSNMSSIGVPPTDMSPVYCEVQRHAEKVPGSIAFSATSVNNKMPSKDIPSVSFDEPSLPEKVPGPSIRRERVAQDPDTVTDAHLDNTPVEDHNPRTLRSSAEIIDEAPIAEEEDLPEDNQEEEEAGANKDDLDMTAATADPDRDVLQNLMEPEATVFNNNTTPPDGRMPEDAKERGKPWKKRSFPFFKKQKRKDPKEEGNQPAQQMQPLLNHMDKMVDEKCLDYVASQLKLKKLDKLCRALGLTDTDVSNYRYELERQCGQGEELVFQMLMKIRATQGVKFTYDKLDRALRESSNVHVADAMVSKFQL